MTSDGVTAFRLQRVTCELPNAPLDVAVAFAMRYRRNRNPTLAPLSPAIAGALAAASAIPAGANVALRAAWRDADAETYVLYDPASRALVERREVLSVAWFVTGGELGEDATGAAGAGSETTWKAPRPGACGCGTTAEAWISAGSRWTSFGDRAALAARLGGASAIPRDHVVVGVAAGRAVC